MTTLSWVGLAIAAVGNLWIIALCFQTGFFWGLGALFLPPVGLVFCVLNIRETWKPLLLAVGGMVLFVSSGSHSPVTT
jgi:hypothetical protein